MKDLFLKYYMGLIIFGVSLSYMALSFFGGAVFENIASGIILVFLALVFTKLRGKMAILIGILLTLSILILIQSENRFELVLEGVRLNIAIVAIFIMSPLLGISVKIGGYINTLKDKLYNFRTNVHFFYLSSMLITHALGIVLNIGTVQINYYLSKVSNVKSNRIIATTLNRGFITTVYWSPYFSSMALIISHMNIAWKDIAIYGIQFSLLTILISYFIDLPLIKKEQNIIKNEDLVEDVNNIKKEENGTVTELVVLLVLIMGITMLADYYIIQNMVLSICIISLSFPFIWSLLKGRWRDYKIEFSNHLTNTLPNLKQELALFLLAGLFSNLFVQSNWRTIFIDSLNFMLNDNYILFSISISLIIVVLAIIGVHPIITVTILVTSINPFTFNITNEYYALLLLYSWAVANTVTPTTAVNNILSSTLKEPLKKVSIYWNIKFSILILILIPIYLTVIYL